MNYLIRADVHRVFKKLIAYLLAITFSIQSVVSASGDSCLHPPSFSGPNQFHRKETLAPPHENALSLSELAFLIYLAKYLHSKKQLPAEKIISEHPEITSIGKFNSRRGITSLPLKVRGKKMELVFGSITDADRKRTGKYLLYNAKAGKGLEVCIFVEIADITDRFDLLPEPLAYPPEHMLAVLKENGVAQRSCALKCLIAVIISLIDKFFLLFPDQHFAGVPIEPVKDSLKGKTRGFLNWYALYRIYGHFLKRGYQIKRQISIEMRGLGRARVYEGWDVRNKRNVIIKTGKTTYHESCHLFSLDGTPLLPPHPNISAPIEHGFLGKRMSYSVFRFSEGRNLRDRLLEGETFDFSRAVNVILQVIEGAEHIHAHGFMHGDLNPRNIIVDDSGHAEIIDFETPFSRRTRFEEDTHCDIFDIGKLFFKMLYPGRNMDDPQELIHLRQRIDTGLGLGAYGKTNGIEWPKMREVREILYKIINLYSGSTKKENIYSLLSELRRDLLRLSVLNEFSKISGVVFHITPPVKYIPTTLDGKQTPPGGCDIERIKREFPFVKGLDNIDHKLAKRNGWNEAKLYVLLKTIMEGRKALVEALKKAMGPENEELVERYMELNKITLFCSPHDRTAKNYLDGCVHINLGSKEETAADLLDRIESFILHEFFGHNLVTSDLEGFNKNHELLRAGYTNHPFIEGIRFDLSKFYSEDALLEGNKDDSLSNFIRQLIVFYLNELITDKISWMIDNTSVTSDWHKNYRAGNIKEKIPPSDTPINTLLETIILCALRTAVFYSLGCAKEAEEYTEYLSAYLEGSSLTKKQKFYYERFFYPRLTNAFIDLWGRVKLKKKILAQIREILEPTIDYVKNPEATPDVSRRVDFSRVPEEVFRNIDGFQVRMMKKKEYAARILIDCFGEVSDTEDEERYWIEARFVNLRFERYESNIEINGRYGIRFRKEKDKWHFRLYSKFGDPVSMKYQYILQKLAFRAAFSMGAEEIVFTETVIIQRKRVMRQKYGVAPLAETIKPALLEEFPEREVSIEVFSIWLARNGIEVSKPVVEDIIYKAKNLLELKNRFESYSHTSNLTPWTILLWAVAEIKNGVIYPEYMLTEADEILKNRKCKSFGVDYEDIIKLLSGHETRDITTSHSMAEKTVAYLKGELEVTEFLWLNPAEQETIPANRIVIDPQVFWRVQNIIRVMILDGKIETAPFAPTRYDLEVKLLDRIIFGNMFDNEHLLRSIDRYMRITIYAIPHIYIVANSILISQGQMTRDLDLLRERCKWGLGILFEWENYGKIEGNSRMRCEVGLGQLLETLDGAEIEDIIAIRRMHYINHWLDNFCRTEEGLKGVNRICFEITAMTQGAGVNAKILKYKELLESKISEIKREAERIARERTDSARNQAKLIVNRIERLERGLDIGEIPQKWWEWEKLEPENLIGKLEVIQHLEHDILISKTVIGARLNLVREKPRKMDIRLLIIYELWKDICTILDYRHFYDLQYKDPVEASRTLKTLLSNIQEVKSLFEALYHDCKDLSENLSYCIEAVSNLEAVLFGWLSDELSLSRFYFNSIIQRAVSLFLSSFENIKFVHHFDENIGEWNGDKTKIIELIICLTKKACEAMPEGGTLTITTKLEGERIILEVSDTGCGIPEEKRENVFEPYSTDQKTGKGMGLDSCRRIVELHNGSISLESRTTGLTGTTFTITLPAPSNTAKPFLAGRHDRELPKLEELKPTGLAVKINTRKMAELVKKYRDGILDLDTLSAIAEDMFVEENELSAELCRLIRQSFIKMYLMIGEDKELCDIFFNKILGAKIRSDENISIRAVKDLPFNSARYYDETNNLAIIALDSGFVRALLKNTGDTRYLPAIQWMMAERVFIHEFSHDNRIGTMEEEIDEECRIIRIRDLIFYRKICYKNSELQTQIEDFRNISGISEATGSGKYFNFLNELAEFLDIEKDMYIKKILDRKIRFKIRTFVSSGYSMDLEWRGPRVGPKKEERQQPPGTREPEEPEEPVPTPPPIDPKGILRKVNRLEKKYAQMTNKKIKAETQKLRQRAEGGKKLHEILPDALALFREASKRALDMRPYDVQILGAVCLFHGKAVEMLTGEGKTLVIAMTAFVNSLAGKGVHIATFNEYLASRDIVWMGPIYELLGVSTGLRLTMSKSYTYSKEISKSLDRLKYIGIKEAYEADITYGSSAIFLFDFERDNLAFSSIRRMQRGLEYAIVDEGDSILIDEAFVPLSISKIIPFYFERDIYKDMAGLAKVLVRDANYTIDNITRTVSLIEKALDKVPEYNKLKEKYSALPDVVLKNCLIQALTAKELLHRDEDYIIENMRVVIIDQFNGRPKYGYMWGGGLHEAVEAKEGLRRITRPSREFAKMCKYLYFKRYRNLSCCSGTLSGVEELLARLYCLETVKIPPNKPVIRKDYPERKLYETRRRKYDDIITRIDKIRKQGRPVLIGTRTIRESENLSERLKTAGIPHRVLSGKYLKQEAEIIAEAGQAPKGIGNVTVITNLAGRGPDIKLGPIVNKKGGLHIIGTEHNISKRIDEQLRGRGGRQGNRGSTEFYTSREDYLITRYGHPEDADPVEDALARAEHALKNDVLLRKTLSDLYEKIQNSFLDCRKAILRLDAPAKKDIQTLIDNLMQIHPVPEPRSISFAGGLILKRLETIEKSTFDQMPARKMLKRSKNLQGKAKILEIMDLVFERFIFRMSILEEAVTMTVRDENEVISLYRECAEVISSEFLRELYSDVVGSYAYNELPSREEKRRISVFTQTRLDKVKTFLELHPDVRKRLEQNIKWEEVIEYIIFNRDMSRSQIAVLFGMKSARAVNFIVKSLLNKINTYEGTLEERKKLYLSNFIKAEYGYLLPKEEEEVLDELARQFDNEAELILKHLKRDGKNPNLGIDILTKRFARAGIELRKLPPKEKKMKRERKEKLDKAKIFLESHLDVRERLEQNPKWKAVIEHIIFNRDKSQSQTAALLRMKSSGTVSSIEKRLLDIINSYEGTFEQRKKLYLSNFIKAEYRYLFPEEEKKVLDELAQQFNNEAELILKHLKRDGKNPNLGIDILTKRFTRSRIELKKPTSKEKKMKRERKEKLDKAKTFLESHLDVRERLEQNPKWKAVIEHIIFNRDMSQSQTAALLRMKSFVAVSSIERRLLDIINTYEGTFEERKNLYLSNFIKAEYRYLLPEEEKKVLDELAQQFDNEAESIQKHLKRDGNNPNLGIDILTKRFARSGIEFKKPPPKEKKMKRERKEKRARERRRRLDTIKKFLTEHPEVRGQMVRRKIDWALYITCIFTEEHMTLQDIAGKMKRSEKVVAYIEKKLFEIIKTYEGPYDERVESYFMNFRTAEYGYLFPDEERNELQKLAEMFHYDENEILDLIRKVNKTTGTRTIRKRFARAGIKLKTKPNIGEADDSAADNVIEEYIKKGKAYELIRAEHGWKVIQIRYDRTKMDRFESTGEKLTLEEMGFTEKRLFALEHALGKLIQEGVRIEIPRFSFIAGRQTLFWTGDIRTSSLIHSGLGRIWHSQADLLKLLDLPPDSTILKDYLLHEILAHKKPGYRHELDPSYKDLEKTIMAYLRYKPYRIIKLSDKRRNISIKSILIGVTEINRLLGSAYLTSRDAEAVLLYCLKRIYVGRMQNAEAFIALSEDDKVIGYAIVDCGEVIYNRAKRDIKLRISAEDELNQSAYLAFIAVHPGCKRREIGLNLFRDAMNFAHETGKGLFCHYYEKTDSLGFYEAAAERLGLSIDVRDLTKETEPAKVLFFRNRGRAVIGRQSPGYSAGEGIPAPRLFKIGGDRQIDSQA